MEIISPLPLGKFVRIKRKALESVEESWLKQKEIKRCKFIGSSSSGSVDALKQLIKGKTPSLAPPEDFDVIDYDVFVTEVADGDETVVTGNGVIPMIPAPANGTNDDGDEDGKYIYDVYWYGGDEGEETLVQETVNAEYRENDYSSNDEDNPENDYPDDEDSRPRPTRDLDDDYSYGYDSETREMMKEFEKNCLGSSSSDEECDEYSHEDSRYDYDD